MPIEDYEFKQLEQELERLKSDHEYEISCLNSRVKELEIVVERLIAAAKRPRTAREAADMTFVPWPTDKHVRYNGAGQPCDMWTGPCACGAFHVEGV
jgi:hypothetical protein